MSTADLYGIDINDIRYLQTEGSERILKNSELDGIMNVWLALLHQKELGEPNKTFDFFGYTPENYRNLEANVLAIFKKKKSEPIKKHLMNGLCNIIYKHLYNSLFWKGEKGFRTLEGVRERIEELKKKTNTEFKYVLGEREINIVTVDLQKKTQEVTDGFYTPDRVHIYEFK